MSSKHWLASVASVAVAAALLPVTTAAAVPARPLTAPAPAPLSASPDIAPQLIVKFEAGHRGAALVRAAAAARGLDVADIRTMGTGALVVRLDETLGERPATALLGDLRSLAGVRYAVPDRLMNPVSVPNDPEWSRQWHYYESTGGINLPAARDLATGSGVTVGVVDTGITPHPDLNSKVVPGYDFISNTGISRDGNGRDSNPNDEGDWIETDDSMCATPDRRFVPSSWHGTHVAGTVAAATDNATGVAGVADSARILPVRVLGHCGGYSSDIIDGMLWAAASR